MSLECYEKIEEFFRYKTGITFQDRFMLFFMRINDLMHRLQLYGCWEFYEKLQNDEEIFLHLVQELVISRSYFFREEGHFALLKDFILKDNPTYAQILSLPCANGEEPYSIAIYLLENGIKDFSIDAVDINPKAIQKAKEGYYTARELFYFPKKMRKKYFYEIDNGYKITSFVKKYINFSCKNLFEYDSGVKRYDYIFCRNLFIYLDEAKKEEAFTIFSSLLKPKGYLFLSFSDYLKTPYAFDKIIQDNKIVYQKMDMG